VKRNLSTATHVVFFFFFFFFVLLCSVVFFLSFFLSFFEKTEMRKWFENNDSRSVVVFSISRNGFYKTLSAAFNKTLSAAFNKT